MGLLKKAKFYRMGFREKAKFFREKEKLIAQNKSEANYNEINELLEEKKNFI